MGKEQYDELCPVREQLRERIKYYQPRQHKTRVHELEWLVLCISAVFICQSR